MRFYGFAAEEITTPDQPSLSLTEDPKSTWAKTHPEFFPVDINRAAREALLRVPGIGYKNVDRILRIRRYHRLTLEDLHKLHVRIKTVAPWIIAADHLPSATLLTEAPQLPTLTPPPQLELFAASSAVTGSL